MKHKIKKIHFIGIGGVGMAGIAEVLHNLSYEVTGSDIANSYTIERLISLGIKINIEHDATCVHNKDVIVVSTAINTDNIELLEAKKLLIPVVPRAMMLAELMRFKYGIAIAGTHGKTTTTSLTSEVFSECNLDPTFIIGGKLSVTGSNAKLGAGDYLIAEADESDASFLYLSPLIAVVTNIDCDHMATYDYDENKLKQVFIDFLHRLPFYGKAVLCNEDTKVREIIPYITKPILTYGFSKNSDIYAIDIHSTTTQMHYTVCINNPDGSLLQQKVVLNLLGMHNVLNSLAVIAVGLECGIKLPNIAAALSKFHGVARRCQLYTGVKINNLPITLIDDYGHHPSELKATISALKNAYPNNRMILIFQPHRYTRTRDLFDDFVNVLSNVNHLIIMEIYSAGEEVIKFADGKSLMKAIKQAGVMDVMFANSFDEVKSLLDNMTTAEDLVLTMGAGNIGKLPEFLLKSHKAN